MSIKLMSKVWDESGCDGSELLMLLSIADFANDEGKAWPAIKTLATKCRLSERQAQALVRKLEKDGHIKIETGQGPHGTNLYWVTAGVKPTAPGGEAHCTGGVLPASPEGVKPTAPDPSLLTIKESEADEKNPSAESQPPKPENPPAVKFYFETFRRKRWGNSEQERLFLETLEAVGQEKMLDAIRWAAQSGVANVKSICTAARKTNKTASRAGPNGRPAERTRPAPEILP